MKPRSYRSFFVLVAGLAAAVPALAAELQPGEYEVKSTTQMKGMPMAMPAQSMTMKHCITAEDLAHGPEKVFRDSQGQCRLSNFSMGGGKVSYNLSCATDGGQMTGSASGSYTATSYQLTSDMKIAAQGMEITSVTNMSARRIGACR